jgi:8-oxo-dGTP pyrophosphatase MutT (NUDIX family)
MSQPSKIRSIRKNMKNKETESVVDKRKCCDVVVHGQKVRVRAVCAIFRDQSNNMLMITENKLMQSGSKELIVGFCGGTISNTDDSIENALLREVYEECILHDQLPRSWNRQWPIVLQRILTAPASSIEYFLHCVYKRLPYSPVYVYGSGPMKVMYYTLTIPTDWIQHFINRGLHLATMDLLNSIYEKTKAVGTGQCKRFLFPIGRTYALIRDREIMAISNSFLDFIRHGIGYVGHGMYISSAHGITGLLKNKEKYSTASKICDVALKLYDQDQDHRGQPVQVSRLMQSLEIPRDYTPRKRRLSKSQDDEVRTGHKKDNLREALRQAALISVMDLSDDDWQVIYDYWHRTDQVQLGWYTTCILRAFSMETESEVIQMLRDYLERAILSIGF